MDDLGHLLVRRVLPQRAKDLAELRRRDGAIEVCTVSQVGLRGGGGAGGERAVSGEEGGKVREGRRERGRAFVEDGEGFPSFG